MGTLAGKPSPVPPRLVKAPARATLPLGEGWKTNPIPALSLRGCLKTRHFRVLYSVSY
jgi:hypothetical protein